MPSIKLSDIRISGFRGLKDISVSLENSTVLTGCNNVGKTSILKALQLALGNSDFLTQEDFFVNESGVAEKIIIDLLFIPINDSGERLSVFSDEWERLFSTQIQLDLDENAFFALRTIFYHDAAVSNFAKEQKVLQRWSTEKGENWQDIDTNTLNIELDSIPFFYIGAQRDFINDIKLNKSFIGKLLSEAANSFDPRTTSEIEEKIKELNNLTITKSAVLKEIQNSLKNIESAIDNDNSKVSIAPFTQKVRDINKSITIYYGSVTNSYAMDYHGMGTRSWSSLLAFESFIQQNKIYYESKGKPFFPIIAIEEPEAHLHPNAQKQIYTQINKMPGQKIISTHSPYVAACADLFELRNLYKKEGVIFCGSLDRNELDEENKRCLYQKVIKTKGEVLFSKALVLFEGETEDQAFPIFAEKYYGPNVISFGLDFVSVEGCGNYYPFLYLAQKFHLPWFIFSDGEETAKKNVLKAYNKAYSANETDINNISNVFVISQNANFEIMLINDGFHTEIEQSLKQLLGEDCIEKHIKESQGKSKGRVRTKETCPTCHQNIYTDILRDFSSSNGRNIAIIELMEKNKAKLAPIIASELIKGNLPPLVEQLFNRIKGDLHL